MNERETGCMMGYQLKTEEQLRAEIHRLVDVVTLPYLEDMRWTVQQYAAKCLNEALEDRRK